MADKNQAIIVIKKKVMGAGHHGGAWKVAYADFVTAMMAFFMVMWLVGSSDNVKKAVAGYFNDPSGFGKDSGSGMAGAGQSIMLNQENMNKLKETLEQAMKEMPEFEELKDQVKMTVTGEGLRVELMETEKGMFFDSGSPDPSRNGQDVLAKLAEQLSKMKNTIMIEGHTDSRPIKGRDGYSNWELSGDRANAARRFMQQHGLRADQVKQVRGFADQALLKSDDPGAANNRRVSIIVQYTNPEPQAEVKEEGEHGKPADGKAKAEGHGKPVEEKHEKPAEGHGKKEAEAKADAQAKPETTAKPEAKGKEPKAEVKKPEPVQVAHAAPPAKAEAKHEAEKPKKKKPRKKKD